MEAWCLISVMPTSRFYPPNFRNSIKCHSLTHDTHDIPTIEEHRPKGISLEPQFLWPTRNLGKKICLGNNGLKKKLTQISSGLLTEFEKLRHLPPFSPLWFQGVIFKFSELRFSPLKSRKNNICLLKYYKYYSFSFLFLFSARFSEFLLNEINSSSQREFGWLEEKKYHSDNEISSHMSATSRAQHAFLVYCIGFHKGNNASRVGYVHEKPCWEQNCIFARCR